MNLTRRQLLVRGGLAAGGLIVAGGVLRVAGWIDERPAEGRKALSAREIAIYAPLIELPDSSGTEINLNCRSPHVMNVTPTFYTKQGEPLVGRSFQMQPAEVKTVDLKTLMPAIIRDRHDLGGMSLS